MGLRSGTSPPQLATIRINDLRTARETGAKSGVLHGTRVHDISGSEPPVS